MLYYAMKTQILIADDYDDAAELLASLLKLSIACETVCVLDGEAAIKQAATCHPDVVILDVDMPVTNGFQAARAIRLMFPERQPTIIACTGRARTDEVIASNVFDATLTKPIELQKLLRVIRGGQNA